MSMYDIIDDALTLTGRYDLGQGQMQVLIKQVARQVSLSGKWGEDYIEVTKEFHGPSPLQSIPVSELGFVVYESVLAILPDGSPVQLEQMLPRHILGSVGTCLAQNSYYSTSQSLEMSCTQPFQTAYIGGYHADIGNDNYWMYTTIPEIITAGLSAQIYRLLGEVESFSMYETEFQRMLAIFKANRADLGTRAPMQANLVNSGQSGGGGGGVNPGPGPGPAPYQPSNVITVAQFDIYGNSVTGFNYSPLSGDLAPDTVEVLGNIYYIDTLAYMADFGEIGLIIDQWPLDVGIVSATLQVGSQTFSDAEVYFSQGTIQLAWTAATAPWKVGDVLPIKLTIVGESVEPPPLGREFTVIPEEFVEYSSTYIGLNNSIGSVDPETIRVGNAEYSIRRLAVTPDSWNGAVHLHIGRDYGTPNKPSTGDISYATMIVDGQTMSIANRYENLSTVQLRFEPEVPIVWEVGEPKTVFIEIKTY